MALLSTSVALVSSVSVTFVSISMVYLLSILLLSALLCLYKKYVFYKQLRGQGTILSSKDKTLAR